MVGELGTIQISEYRLQDLDTQRYMTRRLHKHVSGSAERQATASRFSSDRTSTVIVELCFGLVQVSARSNASDQSDGARVGMQGNLQGEGCTLCRGISLREI